ncbi:c-type cytochrome [Pigmentiphaga aceris]|uniref:C-type cytochrome n=1 Tax=Pigmentiphaga aceris TaxID=1940612 RepID=A0A5C0B6Q3_9BURK|nr:c-type cytochrome [Pigmentiphaga aceris]
MPGLVRVVRDGDFVGVVALSSDAASQAAARVHVAWSAASAVDTPRTVWHSSNAAANGDAGGRPDSASSSTHASSTSASQAHASANIETGASANRAGLASTSASSDDDANDTTDARAIAHEYRWPVTANTDSTWAVAWWHGDGLSVWSAAPALPLRRELSALTGLPLDVVRVLGNGQATCDAAFDVAADAVLLSRAVGRAVHVSNMSNAQGSVYVDQVLQPSGSGKKAADARGLNHHEQPGSQADTARGRTSIRATLAGDGYVLSQTIHADGSHLSRPSLARLLSDGGGTVNQPGLVPYRFDAASLAVPENAAVATVAQAGAAQQAAQVFAQESFIDEAAAASEIDPVDYRLRHLDDARGAALVRQVSEHAGWAGTSSNPDQRAGNKPGSAPNNGSTPRTGRGFAYASVIDDSVDPAQRSWSAWVADVAVDPTDGRIDITRVVVGHDLEHMQAAAPGARQIEDQVRDTTGRLLQAPAAFDDWGTTDTPGTAIVPSADVNVASTNYEVAPASTTVSVPTGLAWSDAASLPAAAAVANAIFDATGVRLREPPFNGAAARAALTTEPRRPSRRVAGAWLGGIAAAATGLLVTAMPWRAEIPPVTPDLSIYSTAAIDRGRLVAAAGDCVVCHTVPGGTPNTGGLALDTPFGQIFTTNITPDPETGIGMWSFQAFDRAMRQGIHRDGRQLYPAFPYTDFAKLTDADMQALYAYLMSEPAVRATPPETKLAFPFSVRPLMAGWNLLFHENKVYQPDETQSTVWNRGAYLVQGIGHCGACHTPRNALGAEKTGAQAWLAGGEAEGWEAPPLNALSRSPIPWTENDYFSYLRTGFSPAHGVAAGPMAPVVQGLSQLPEQDVRAMAVYLASLNPVTTTDTERAASITALETAADRSTQVFPPNGERIFEGACAVCHDTRNAAPMFGVRPPLALNTNLHSDKPDNLIQVILNGIADPATGDLGYMPAFGNSMNDTQIADLIAYMRARYAPDKAAWENVPDRVNALRKNH